MKPIFSPVSKFFATIGLCTSVWGTSGCNEHVFEIVEPCATRVIQEEVPVALSKAADILIVIDNSGSMCEEQDNLAANFFDENCPITDLANVPEEYRNPPDDVLAELAVQCGFIQILAAFDNDYRVGVITTDVALADNRFGIAESQLASSHCDGTPKPDFGRRPQRGCLQSPPGQEKNYIARGDPNTGTVFRDTLSYISTYGSPFERGLDATKIFLDPSETKHPQCVDDLDNFIRDSAQLIVIYLTDEEDCSHVITEDFPDENAGDDGVATQGTDDLPIFPIACYEFEDSLVPVTEYADFLKAFKGPGREEDVRVAVIAGGVFDDVGGIAPAGCRIVDDLPNGQCTPSQGNSNNLAICPDTQEPPCCEADSGKRYYDLATAMGPGNALTDSICYSSFRSTMVSIAQFAARIEFVELSEAPASPAAILVQVQREGEDEPQKVERIPDDQDPEGQNGWQLEGDKRIRFYGDALPQPGDEVFVSALGERETTESSSCTSVADDGSDGNQNNGGAAGDAGQ